MSSTGLRRVGWGKTLASYLMLCLLSTLVAPALEAAPRKATTTEDAGTATTTSTDDDEDSGDEDEDEDDEDRASDDDELYSRVPRNDRVQLNRTLGALVGGLLVGLIGLPMGMTGFLLAGAIGAGLGYVIAREMFPDPVQNDPRFLTDPYYDSRYGYGSMQPPARGGGYTAPDGSSLRDLQEAYFDSMQEYRNALRTSDFERIQQARTAYQTAYQALLQGQRTAR